MWSFYFLKFSSQIRFEIMILDIFFPHHPQTIDKYYPSWTSINFSTYINILRKEIIQLDITGGINHCFLTLSFFFLLWLRLGACSSLKPSLYLFLGSRNFCVPFEFPFYSYYFSFPHFINMLIFSAPSQSLNLPRMLSIVILSMAVLPAIFFHYHLCCLHLHCFLTYYGIVNIFTIELSSIRCWSIPIIIMNSKTKTRTIFLHDGAMQIKYV